MLMAWGYGFKVKTFKGSRISDLRGFWCAVRGFMLEVAQRGGALVLEARRQAARTERTHPAPSPLLLKEQINPKP